MWGLVYVGVGVLEGIVGGCMLQEDRGGKGMATYHHGHANALDECGEEQKPADDVPPSNPSLHTARDDDDEGDQRAQLDGDVKRNEEADGPPHVAEGLVRATLFLAREGDVFRLGRDVGVAAVEPVGESASVVVLGVTVSNVEKATKMWLRGWEGMNSRRQS